LALASHPSTRISKDTSVTSSKRSSEHSVTAATEKNVSQSGVLAAAKEESNSLQESVLCQELIEKVGSIKRHENLRRLSSWAVSLI